MATITIDPITRIEGHMKVEVVTDGGVVKEARSSGTLFRGFENILKGRDPRDAQRLTQRVCGVCPAVHGTAAALNLDSAFGVDDKIPDNGRIMRNLILASNYLQSHVLHFYHLAALDYVDVTAVAGYEGDDANLRSVSQFVSRGELAPFVPRYEGDYRLSKDENRAAVAHYVAALDMRRVAHEMLATFGGKMPHNAAVVPGGCTEVPTADKIASFLWRLNQLREFIDNVYIPDVILVAENYADYFEIGKGCGKLLSYGVFDLEGGNPDLATRKRLFVQGTVDENLTAGDLDTGKITECVKHSWYADQTSGRHPSEGETQAEADKQGGYSWIKAPRYGDEVYEVGPLARMAVTYVKGNGTAKPLVDGVLDHFKAPPSALFSVLGRHAARALDAKLIADKMAEWVLQLKPGEPTCASYEIPEESMGMGITDGPRGALGHWISIKDHVIDRYQLVVPTTWNASPKDDQGRPGPIEQALIGTKIRDEENPFEVVRIVRAFDPCLACSIHLITPKGRTLGVSRVS